MDNNILDIKLVEEKIKGMSNMVEMTMVRDQKSLEEVAEKIKAIKTLGKLVRAEMEKYTKPAQEIINNARAKYLPFEKECDNAEKKLKLKALVYMQLQEAEQKKKEVSIAQRVEKGQLKEETGLKKLEELGEAQKNIKTESGAKLQMKTVRVVTIVDPEKVPHEYWVIDETKVRKVALAGVSIPGVEVIEEKQMSA